MSEHSNSWRDFYGIAPGEAIPLPPEAMVIFKLNWGQLELRNMGTHLEVRESFTREGGRLTVEPAHNNEVRLRVERDA